MLLIICKSKKISSEIAGTFRYMSILAYGATPTEALSEVSGLYRAALIINPTELGDVSDYIKRIKSYKRDLPIFAVTDEEIDTLTLDQFDAVFRKPTFSTSLAQKIIEFANEHSRARIGDYRLAGIDASSDRVGVTYFDKRVRLTKTEAMILRYLIRSYPLPQSSESILKHVFKSSRMPEAASVRTHISLMNKKLEQITERKMIVSVAGAGYIVMTPEYALRCELNK